MINLGRVGLKVRILIGQCTFQKKNLITLLASEDISMLFLNCYEATSIDLKYEISKEEPNCHTSNY